ncbi:MAG: type II toxin-antitoxin system RelE/ParE family toxin [Ramlibacter sp.]
MTRLLVTVQALDDIDRLCDFLADHLAHEAARTAQLIAQGLDILKAHPLVGRLSGQGMRELVISRGTTGYLALYAYDKEADVVSVLAVRHQREAGYQD